ncbi:MAG: ECF RNA polymerase sigma-E factor [Thermoanaerobaculia bacterium]|nr:ECF RNA polymerase sigma-E factor [Thermoanaerobaculia bacterium]
MPSPVKVPERQDWPGDERAITRFLAGDVAGFELIVRRYSSMVFSVAARMLGPSEAEDVVQETFLRAYRGLERFRGESTLKTWLLAIALNRIRARRGILSRLREYFVPNDPKPGQDDGEELFFSNVPDPNLSPEDEALQRQRRQKLRSAMAALPSEFRTAVILRDLEGMSYQEIAEALEVPVGTVRSRIARGRSMLKERLS